MPAEPQESPDRRPAPHEPARPAPRRPAPERRSFGHQLEEIRRVILNFAFLCIVGLLAYTAVRLLSENNAVVEPLGLPKAIKDLGYSEDAAALAVTSNLQKLKEQAQSGDNLIIVKARAEEQDIEVPVGEVNVTSFIRLLRQIIGLPQKRITGDIVCPTDVCNTKSLELRLRILDGVNPPKLLAPVTGENPDALLKKGAEAVLRETDPLSLALVLYGDNPSTNQRRSEAIAIANEMIANGDANSFAAHNLVGIGIIDSGATEEAPLNEALQHFEAAIALKPDYPLPYINKGLALRRLGHLEEAIAAIDKSFALGAQEPAAYLNKAVSLKALGKLDDAIATLKDGAKTFPDNADILTTLGGVQVDKGQTDDAIKTLNDALQSVAANPGASFNLGMAYRAKGEKEKAAAAFQDYLKFAPEAEDKVMVEGWIADLQK
jgi:tetratricopeptide (TPR) repeat protein